jgi:DNA-binding MarR family transcriptional regulator
MTIDDLFDEEHPERQFTGFFVPVDLLNRADLRPTEILLLAEIDALTKSDRERGTCATAEHFAEHLHITPGAIKNSLSLLRNLGYIEDVRFDGRRRWIRLCAPFIACLDQTQRAAVRIDDGSHHVSRARKTSRKDKKENKHGWQPSFDFADEELQAEWAAYQEHRRQKRQVMTEIARGRAVRDLSAMGKERAIAALRHTIAKGWTGIYEPKTAAQQQGKPDFSRMDIGALQRMRVRLKNSVNWKKGDAETERVKPTLLAIKEELKKRGKGGLYYTSTY